VRQPRSDDDEPRELVRADPPAELSGPEAIAHLLDQSNREAAANRAQARELIKALEGVQRSQEYMGTALQEERARSKGLMALVILAPIVAAAGAWYVWRHVDDTRSEMDARLAQIAADAKTARAEDAANESDARATQVAADLEAVRRDLEASRGDLAAERKHLAEREAALTSAQNRADGAHTEIDALEFEVKSAKSKTGAAEARGAILETRIHQLQTELDAAKTKAAAPAPAAAAPATATSAVPSPSEAPTPVVKAAPSPPSAADVAAAEKARVVLNTLLGESGDAVRYQFTAVGGLGPRSLTGVKVVGTDDKGAVIRTIQAARAEVVCDEASGTVVIRFFDGKLLVGLIEAPFFDGTYGLIVRGDPKKWRSSGLDCVK
jgi:hypothetical protein